MFVYIQNLFSKIDFDIKINENLLNLILYKILEYLQTKMHVIDKEFVYVNEYQSHLINSQKRKQTHIFILFISTFKC